MTSRSTLTAAATAAAGASAGAAGLPGRILPGGVEPRPLQRLVDQAHETMWPSSSRIARRTCRASS